MVLHKVTTLTKCDFSPPLSINGKGKCFLVFDQTTLPARRVVESCAFFFGPSSVTNHGNRAPSFLLQSLPW